MHTGIIEGSKCNHISILKGFQEHIAVLAVHVQSFISNCSTFLIFQRAKPNAPARLPNYTKKMAANMGTVINTEIFSKLGEQLQQLRRYDRE